MPIFRLKTMVLSLSVQPTVLRLRLHCTAINAIANPQVPEVGERYLGTVVKVTDFGGSFRLTPGKDGLLHISEMRKLNGGKRVVDAEDVVSVGQKVQVEITKIDDRGKLSLSR